jgi:hypothetical protein
MSVPAGTDTAPAFGHVMLNPLRLTERDGTDAWAAGAAHERQTTAAQATTAWTFLMAVA